MTDKPDIIGLMEEVSGLREEYHLIQKGKQNKKARNILRQKINQKVKIVNTTLGFKCLPHI